MLLTPEESKRVAEIKAQGYTITRQDDRLLVRTQDKMVVGLFTDMRDVLHYFWMTEMPR